MTRALWVVASVSHCFVCAFSMGVCGPPPTSSFPSPPPSSHLYWLFTSPTHPPTHPPTHLPSQVHPSRVEEKRRRRQPRWWRTAHPPIQQPSSSSSSLLLVVQVALLLLLLLLLVVGRRRRRVGGWEEGTSPSCGEGLFPFHQHAAGLGLVAEEVAWRGGWVGWVLVGLGGRV